MTHAEKCPVCNGSGKYWLSTPESTNAGYYITCHGCGGKGWIEVSDEPIKTCPCPYPWYPWYPYTYEWQYNGDGNFITFTTSSYDPHDCGHDGEHLGHNSFPHVHNVINAEDIVSSGFITTKKIFSDKIGE